MLEAKSGLIMYGSPHDIVRTSVPPLRATAESLLQELTPNITDFNSDRTCDEPTNILELGAGTGGTTSKLLPLLASLKAPVTYTISDISPSLVSAARKRLKEYSFVRFPVVDIEAEPSPEFLNRYHIVLATNCVHATQSLARSTGNILRMLRSDGCLLMFKMTAQLLWIELIFSVLDGWWVFNDGREHALADPLTWKSTLYEVGYKRVEWKDGEFPESRIQRLILAMVADVSHPLGAEPFLAFQNADSLYRIDLDAHVKQYASDFSLLPSLDLYINRDDKNEYHIPIKGNIALITGSTGSLGSHIAEVLASQQHFSKVVCFNRPNRVTAKVRQEEALLSRGINLEGKKLSKLMVVEGDAAMPFLGVSPEQYTFLACNVTHIIHNAWPMSLHRTVTADEPQFKGLRNLIQLAADCHAFQERPITFQFISSISVIGLHPLCVTSPPQPVPEIPSSAAWTLPNGYSGAKYICEEIIANTVGNHPAAFNSVMSVRIDQISGSRITGYWNLIEHFAFLVRSSQTLGVLTDLNESLSWCPVDEVAATLVDFLLHPVNENTGNASVHDGRNLMRNSIILRIRIVKIGHR